MWVVGACWKGQRGGQELRIIICQTSKTGKCNSLARLGFLFQVRICSVSRLESSLICAGAALLYGDSILVS